MAWAARARDAVEIKARGAKLELALRFAPNNAEIGRISRSPFGFATHAI
jgi:hypothetical protein